MIKTKKLLLGASRLRQIMAYCQFFLLMPTMYLTNIPMFECVVSMSINFLKLSGGAGGGGQAQISLPLSLHASDYSRQSLMGVACTQFSTCWTVLLYVLFYHLVG
jgi:hypothetical protein